MQLISLGTSFFRATITFANLIKIPDLKRLKKTFAHSKFHCSQKLSMSQQSQFFFHLDMMLVDKKKRQNSLYLFFLKEKFNAYFLRLKGRIWEYFLFFLFIIFKTIFRALFLVWLSIYFYLCFHVLIHTKQNKIFLLLPRPKVEWDKFRNLYLSIGI